MHISARPPNNDEHNTMDTVCPLSSVAKAYHGVPQGLMLGPIIMIDYNN